MDAPAGTFQDPPRLANTWEGDPLLRSLVAALLPPDGFSAVAPHLRHLGQRAAGDLLELAAAAEAQPPRHVPYDAWGRRVDRLELSPGWLALKRVAAEEGLVATGYERTLGSASRVYQHALLYLFHPSAATYLCPLAMTDGAARLLETTAEPPLASRVLPRLLARDPQRFWTSGQWMTERGGGSDVGGGTETVAIRGDDTAGDDAGSGYRLHGSKWFTSAIDSDIAITLARLPAAPAGSAGLSAFYVELRDAAGRLQGIRLERLKDKLGTRALPTAELTLAGTPATLVGAPGAGVRTIATLMNVTRLYNTNAAVSGMRRAVDLARDYARRRRAFGRLLAEQPLHRETLAGLQAEVAGGLVLLFRAALLQGREECGDATAPERSLLRLLTPLAKLATGKQAVAVASEALECFGGAGYIEDTGLPRLLRDAQVLPIWEGTTNVLSLDVLRALDREEALPALLGDAAAHLPAGPAPAVDRVRETLAAVATALQSTADGERRQAAARRLALALARSYAAALLLAQAARAEASGDPAAPLWAATSRRWVARLAPPTPPAAEELTDARLLAGEELPAAVPEGAV
ncbi:MAG TPA: acyl-CoA dehydrogenase family protein [Thermoanaerobaculia bacterium]|jgi:putative acyl-CoA dehydrogenase|nr:acyl-CoA dehydrogenase family protein [Thermoanaerobaculia bacterium]